jgi:hypothetical protein
MAKPRRPSYVSSLTKKRTNKPIRGTPEILDPSPMSPWWLKKNPV